MDIDLPSTSTSNSQVRTLIDRETQTVSYNKDILLRRKVKTLKQKVKRRDVKISNMKDVIRSISKSGHSNENLDEVLKKHFEGKKLQNYIFKLKSYSIFSFQVCLWNLYFSRKGKTKACILGNADIHL